MSTIRRQYWNFGFFQEFFLKKIKTFSYFHNFGWMWLVNELLLTFSVPIKYDKAQFNPIILSRVIEYTTYYYYYCRQIVTFLKAAFSDSGGFKT